MSCSGTGEPLGVGGAEGVEIGVTLAGSPLPASVMETPPLSFLLLPPQAVANRAKTAPAASSASVFLPSMQPPMLKPGDPPEPPLKGGFGRLYRRLGALAALTTDAGAKGSDGNRDPAGGQRFRLHWPAKLRFGSVRCGYGATA